MRPRNERANVHVTVIFCPRETITRGCYRVRNPFPHLSPVNLPYSRALANRRRPEEPRYPDRGLPFLGPQFSERLIRNRDP